MIIIFFKVKNKKIRTMLQDLNNLILRPTIKLQLLKQTVQYSCKKGHADPWNRTESLEIDPYLYDQLIFNKIIKMRKRVFSTRGARIIEYP